MAKQDSGSNSSAGCNVSACVLVSLLESDSFNLLSKSLQLLTIFITL